ncbi:SusC/RagA family TonB-linked outer membrane protein [Draconibacterium mangrovi]|uniref:SusC/RagA family TonB-linked outer membrane protein n=1 Tax=Draconibacterium mangrovi TaxID=2697469 RepID=UPI0013D12D75|nr:TonB-dependent receptor [Draconibacterium mangrovi]
MKKNYEFGKSLGALFRKLVLISTLTLVLIQLSIICVNASVYSQNTKLTLEMKQASIKEVLEKIELQSNFRFIYQNEKLDMDKRVDVYVTNQTVESILTLLFEKGEVEYSITESNLILIKPKQTKSTISSNQTTERQGTIFGKVTDEFGEPLPGVSIVIKGTVKGTVTDFNGAYSIEALPEDVLQFSFVGMLSQEIPVGSQTAIDVIMKVDAIGLEEVVTIGYGTQKRTTVTGSVVSSKGEDILKTPEPNIANTLIGRLPGLITNNRSGEPGYENTEILIRGRSTLGDNSPLIVVDGVADRAGGFDHIDANDIESISVLKDASAAIYGSRAANGVILVTTRRGQSGKPTISLSSNFGIRQPTVIPEMLNSADYAVALNEIETNIYGRSPMYTDEQIAKFRDGSDPTSYPNVDWMDETLRTFAPQTQHNLSIRGGTERVKYFLSTGYQYQDNYYKKSASNYKQYNLRSNIDVQATDYLKLFANISLRQENRNSPHYGSEAIWRYLVKGDPRVNIRWPENGLPVLAPQDDFNPVTCANGEMGYQANKRSYVNIDLGFNLDLASVTEGLSLDGGLYIDRSDNFYKHFQKAFFLYGYDINTDEYFPRQYGPNNAALNEDMSQNLGITANIKLNYKRTFNDIHSVSAFVAYEQYESRYDYLYGRRQDFVSTSIEELFAGDENTALNNGSASETGRMNYFGRFDYGFKEKYLVQFNWRYDGSENFPKGNRFGFFPGASVGWRISEENFWQDNLSFIGYFKLKGSWGQMGNDRISKYQYLTTYTFGDNATLGGSSPESQVGITQVRTANPNVKWEVATTSNIGFESRFLDNFSFDFDLFKTKREDILANGASYVPDYTGLSLPAENIGECETKGLEAVLGYNKNFGELNLAASTNFSYAKSKILYFDEPETMLEWQKQTGKSIGANWLLYEAIGVFSTQEELDNTPHLSNAQVGDLIFRDVDEDGTIDGNDRIRPDKTTTPEIVYGLNVGLNYKNWDLSMLWQGATNVWQYVFFESGGIGNFTQDFFDNRWTENNINADYPRIYDRQVTSSAQKNTFWLKDASYLRLKNIELAYNLPSTVTRRLPFSNVRVFGSASNLLTITELNDVDPETTEGSQGFAAWSTPQARVFNFGLNITF